MGYYPVYPLKPCFHAQVGIPLLSSVNANAASCQLEARLLQHILPLPAARNSQIDQVGACCLTRCFLFPQARCSTRLFLEGRSLSVHVLAETSSPPRRTPCCRVHKLVLDLASNYRAPYAQVPLSWHRGSRLLLSTARRWPAAEREGPGSLSWKPLALAGPVSLNYHAWLPERSAPLGCSCSGLGPSTRYSSTGGCIMLSRAGAQVCATTFQTCVGCLF